MHKRVGSQYFSKQKIYYLKFIAILNLLFYVISSTNDREPFHHIHYLQSVTLALETVTELVVISQYPLQL